MKAMEAFKMLLILCSIGTSTALDSMSPVQSITDGKTIISAGESFELGFFSPGSSENRYLGIWYKKISTGTVVWVANRETPLSDYSGVLTMTSQVTLVLRNSAKDIIWRSNSSRTLQKPVAQLLDSGNLVVRDGIDSDPRNYAWQSFDYPCDTLLPDMRLGTDFLASYFSLKVSFSVL